MIALHPVAVVQKKDPFEVFLEHDLSFAVYVHAYSWQVTQTRRCMRYANVHELFSPMSVSYLTILTYEIVSDLSPI